MGLLDLFRRAPPSAQVAKERLRIIVAQERSARSGGPDYLPLLRRELLAVIHKYVNVDPEAVHINLDRAQGREVLELSVALPSKMAGAVGTSRGGPR
jgi:cell division topological specificity factor